MNFEELGLRPALLRRCESLGYEQPTPIQRRAIPVVLTGRDLIGCAETGTGKTAAFLLPIIQRLTETPRPGVRVLVVAPTRELAAQTETFYADLNTEKRNRCVNLIGGASISRQMSALKQRPAVVVATPGRLLDMVERGAVDLSGVEVLVLDEADRMLDMGFWPSIRRVLELLPKERQTLLFSATMSPEIEQLARRTMRDAELVEVGPRGQAAGTVEQTAYAVPADSKMALLLDLLEREQETSDFERVLVFTRTRRGADRLSHILEARDHSADCIHADRTQPQREAALEGFKSGRTRVLVATDIAARGIDVDSVSHVINYDVPEQPEDYVHRIGRTGRAGKTGRAITLVTPVEEFSMRAIERLTGQQIGRVQVAGFGDALRTASGLAQPAAKRAAASRRTFRPRRGRR